MLRILRCYAGICPDMLSRASRACLSSRVECTMCPLKTRNRALLDTAALRQTEKELCSPLSRTSDELQKELKSLLGMGPGR